MCRLTPDLIVDAQGLRGILPDIESSPFLAVDTEMDSFFHYHERVCLFQLSTERGDYLIDPICVDLAPLKPIFSNPEHTTIFHAGENDIPHLRREHGLEFARVFDTYIAANILGSPHKGLAGLLEEHFSIAVDKKYQKADWHIRPLPDDMAEYARGDTRYLIPLRAILFEQLRETKYLDDAEKAFARAANTVMHERVFDADNWVKLKDIHNLPQDCRGVARSLYVWRDNLASKLNLQVFRVLPDHVIVRLAELHPTTKEELLEDFINSVHLEKLARNASSLIQTIKEGLEVGYIPLPKPKNKHQSSFSREQIRYFNRLRNWRNKQAEINHCPADVVVTNRILANIVTALPHTVENLRDLGELSNTQLDKYASSIIEILNS